jgi:hypothetical protein
MALVSRVGDRRDKQGGEEMDPYGAYTSALVALSVAVLLISAGLAKKQIEWKRSRPLPIRGRRRKP